MTSTATTWAGVELSQSKDGYGTYTYTCMHMHIHKACQNTAF